MKEDKPIGQDPQDEHAYRVAYLIAGYIRDNLTQVENEELDNWVTASMDNQRLFEELTDPKNLEAWLKWKEQLPMAQVLERLKSRLKFTPPRIKPRIRSLWQYVAAASVLLAVVISFVLMERKQTNKQAIKTIAMANDLQPGANHAILTMANGEKIMLDTAHSGSLALLQGNINLIKKDSGELSYQLINPSLLPPREEFNTLQTPAGGQFKLVLPDGSKVWLNAASSITYPTAFSGSKRTVTLTGEAYFEVAKDPMFPFAVRTAGTTIVVLGTHFNVNAYIDEPHLAVTLEEGSVKVNEGLVLKPGEQTQVNPDGKMQTISADMEAVLAWKNGNFIFRQATLESVMRQLARWYNCDINYQSAITEHFNASVLRDVPVSKLLHLLEETGAVHFKIEDKKITVMK